MNINNRNQRKLQLADNNDVDSEKDEFYDCREDEDDDEKDNDEGDDSVEFSELCKSPSQFERIRKRGSKKQKPYVPKFTTYEATAASGESSSITEATATKISKSRLTLETHQHPGTATAAAAKHEIHHHKSLKIISRVQSLPQLTNNQRRAFMKQLNTRHNLNESDSKSDIVYDIDDDLMHCFDTKMSTRPCPGDNKNDNIMDDYDYRSKFYDKFCLILRVMLKPTNSFDYLRLNSQDSTVAATPIATAAPSFPKNTLPSYVYEYYYYYNNQQPTSDQLQAHSNENLWFNLYDYFANYNKRSKNLDEIKENLYQTRSACVKPTIQYILNINFDLITKSMQQDLETESLQTVSDFRRLNESPKYICKLSYLYCYVEDILNRVGYIESLYPSLKALENEEPLYASQEFDDRIKTLLLWYNVMTDLMRQCDLFGRFLGFTKRDSYLELWTWFDKNQNYSRREYEKIQLMLNSNGGLPLSPPALNKSKSSTNAFLSPQTSLIIPKSATSETVSTVTATASPQPLPRSPKFNRQVSFELNASKPTKNLIYNQRSSIDDSFINTSSANTFANNRYSGQSSFNSSGGSIGAATPLPEKLQKFFSFQSTGSSHKTNDSVPPSLYASLVRDSFDEEDEDEILEQPDGSTNEEQTRHHSHDHDLISTDYHTDLATHDGSNTGTPTQHNQITREKIYQDFIHKRLSKQGLAATCKQILNMIGNTLPRSRAALETQQIDPKSMPKSATLEFFSYHWMPLHQKCHNYIARYNHDDETSNYSINCKEFKDLNLPTFRPLYLYLINCIIDLMNTCMKMYIDMYNRAHTDNFSFSLLSTEQLTNECRECIEHAILVRQYYHYMIFSVFTKTELDRNPIENDLDKFDWNLKELINIYLKYVANWVSDTLLMNSLSLNVLEKEWNFCKNNLCYVSIGEDSYAKSFCSINCGIIESLSQYLNEIESKYKQPLIDTLDDPPLNESCSASGSSCDDDDGDDGLDSDERNSQKNILRSIFDLGPSHHHPHHHYANETDSDDNAVHYKCNELKLQIRELRDRTMKALTFCRSFMNDLELAAKYEVKSKLRSLLDCLKNYYFLVNFNGDPSFMIFVPNSYKDDKRLILRLLYMTSARDDCTSGATVAGASTESSSGGKKQPLSATVSTPISTSSIREDYDLMRRTTAAANSTASKAAMHRQVRRLTSANITDNSQQNQQSFLESLSLIANSASDATQTASMHHQDDKGIYLLFLSISTEDQQNKNETAWKGMQINLKASVDVKLSLFQHKTDPKKSYLYLVVAEPQLLCDKKIEMKSNLKGHITLVKERTSFHPNIASELDELNMKILKNLRCDAFKFIKSLEDETTKHFKEGMMAPSLRKNIIRPRYLLEIWRVCYNYGIELHTESVKFVTQDLQCDFSIGLAEFCKLWCKYVLDKTEEGYGRTTKPSWARKGFQLMNEVFKPHNSQHLTGDQFDELRNCVEECIKHVIGTKRDHPHKGSFDAYDAANLRRKTGCGQVYEKSVSLNEQRVKTSGEQGMTLGQILSNTSSNSSSSSHIVRSQSSVLTPKQVFLQEQQIKMLLPPHKRFNLNCRRCDDIRACQLQEDKLIGSVVNKPQNSLTMNEAKISVRRVDFRWQRGNKIGTGQSGIVYACVNLDTGEMMAMKEIQYRPNDVQMIKALADEIANIEGIKNENLVKFYGVELHKKEILIFMEFCGDKCTLDQISRESSGLPEELVRSYTHALLNAVIALHERNIIHRDIKGANIFLKTTESKDERKKTTLKLGDFGSSVRLKPDASSKSQGGLFAQGLMGTYSYMAPEVMMSDGVRDNSVGYTTKADIWSVGCVVIEMFTGKRPWFPLKNEQIMFKVFKNEKPTLPQNINQEAKDFLKRCLEFDPDKRYDAYQCMAHPFVKIAEDRVSS